MAHSWEKWPDSDRRSLPLEGLQEPFKASAVKHTLRFREFLQLSQSGLAVPPPLEASLSTLALINPPPVKAKHEEPAERLRD